MRASALAFAGLLALSVAGTAVGDDMAGMRAAPAARIGKGTGVITAIDAKAGTLTIRHQPIAAFGWPAMTMIFKAAPPTLLRGLRVGRAIRFDARMRGVKAEVTAIRPK